MSTIHIKEIEKLFKIIIDKLNDDLVETVELKTGFYRTIAADDWDFYNPKSIEDIVIVGDLQDEAVVIGI